MSKTILSRVKNKFDTHTNFTSKNPVLLKGEMVVVDTGNDKLQIKIGDGSSAYNSLPFLDDSASYEALQTRVTALETTLQSLNFGFSADESDMEISGIVTCTYTENTSGGMTVTIG